MRLNSPPTVLSVWKQNMLDSLVIEKKKLWMFLKNRHSMSNENEA